MWPDAQARIASPTSATAPPTASERRSGRANTMKTAAQANPRGTRQRCTHVPPLRATDAHLGRLRHHTGAAQALADRLGDARDLDVHADPLRAGAAVAVRAAADVRALDA